MKKVISSIFRHHGVHYPPQSEHIHDQKTFFEELKNRLKLTTFDFVDSEEFDKVIEILFDVEDIPILTHTTTFATKLDDITDHLGISPEFVNQRVDSLAERGLIYDMSLGSHRYVMIPEFVVGWYELAMLNYLTGNDKERLCEELSAKKNINIQEVCEFIYVYGSMFCKDRLNNETKWFRAAPYDLEESELVTNILPYETALSLIDSCETIRLIECVCKNIEKQRGEIIPDDIPMECCMMIDSKAEATSNFGRMITREEAKEVIKKCADLGHVHHAENCKNITMFCNCDKRWCGLLKESLNHGENYTMTSSYYPHFIEENCVLCGKCIEKCPMDCLEVKIEDDDDNEKKNNKKKTYVGFTDSGKDFCLGCLVCEYGCEYNAIQPMDREKKVFTPENFIEMNVYQAFERNKLHTKIFGDVHSDLQKKLRKVMEFIEANPLSQKIKSIEPLKSKFLSAIAEKAKNDLLKLKEN